MSFQMHVKSSHIVYEPSCNKRLCCGFKSTKLVFSYIPDNSNTKGELRVNVCDFEIYKKVSNMYFCAHRENILKYIWQKYVNKFCTLL